MHLLMKHFPTMGAQHDNRTSLPHVAALRAHVPIRKGLKKVYASGFRLSSALSDSSHVERGKRLAQASNRTTRLESAAGVKWKRRLPPASILGKR